MVDKRTNVRYNKKYRTLVLLEAAHMSELKDVITSYNSLSFSDRIVFYNTISNDITISDDTQSFLMETRFEGEGYCIYCEGKHVVKNGKRKDGIQVCVPCMIAMREKHFF